MKPIILAIVGESGSGKTTAAEYLEHKYGFELIQSRTTRSPRYEGENGHTFVSNEEFDTYTSNDIIALTNFGGNRYCCLHRDVKGLVNTYVIDEHGMIFLKDNYSNIYDIRSIRIVRDVDDRIKSVGHDRVKRDEGKFNLSLSSYDYFIYSDGLEVLYDKLDKYVKQNLLDYVKLG